MRLFYSFICSCTLIASGALLMTACKKDEVKANYNSDKSRLKALIDSVTLVYNGAVEGTKPGNFSVGSKQPLKTTIDLALQVNTGATYTQEDVDNALSNLRRSAQEFASRLIQEVSVANLVAQWKLDGNANDASGRGRNGQLKTGWMVNSAGTAMDGATLPVAAPDRFNRANMAYSFNKGAQIEVPYDVTLNPQNLTVSLWVKTDSTYSNNYLISLNRWNGFKIQLQSNNFVFMTFKDNAGMFHDVDDNPGVVPKGIWTHVAVSYTSGAMKFYINGVLVKTANETGVPVTLPSPVNLSIGNELPPGAYTHSGGTVQFSGNGFFMGSMDDIRFYSTALTDAEVLSIYTIERSL